MAGHATRLFMCQEAIETRRVHITIWDQLWCAILFVIPMDALRARKYVLHEFTLAAYHDFHTSLTNLWDTHTLETESMLPIISSKFRRLELNVGIHSLASRSFHDDMSRVTMNMGGDQMGDRHVFADELMHLRNADRVWDLTKVAIISCCHQDSTKNKP